eukprot:6203560-Lingulodinium_polyedra.AAC.1
MGRRKHPLAAAVEIQSERRCSKLMPLTMEANGRKTNARRLQRLARYWNRTTSHNICVRARWMATSKVSW